MPRVDRNESDKRARNSLFALLPCKECSFAVASGNRDLEISSSSLVPSNHAAMHQDPHGDRSPDRLIQQA